MADTADITANTPSILARYRREADTSSAAANRENTATGEVQTGAAVTGEAVIGAAVTGVAATDSVDLVIRTIGVGTLLGVGAIPTRTRTTAIILIGLILRMCTIMIITAIAPYQESGSLGPNPACCKTPRIQLHAEFRCTTAALMAAHRKLDWQPR